MARQCTHNMKWVPVNISCKKWMVPKLVHHQNHQNNCQPMTCDGWLHWVNKIYSHLLPGLTKNWHLSANAVSQLDDEAFVQSPIGRPHGRTPWSPWRSNWLSIKVAAPASWKVYSKTSTTQSRKWWRTTPMDWGSSMKWNKEPSRICRWAKPFGAIPWRPWWLPLAHSLAGQRCDMSTSGHLWTFVTPADEKAALGSGEIPGGRWQWFTATSRLREVITSNVNKNRCNSFAISNGNV